LSTPAQHPLSLHDALPILGALAAHQVAFDANHRESVFGQALSDFLATDTHAENDGVDALSHRASRCWWLPVEPLRWLPPALDPGDRKSTRLNSSHVAISYA